MKHIGVFEYLFDSVGLFFMSCQIQIRNSNPKLYQQDNIVAGAFFGQRYNQGKSNIAKFLLVLER